MAPVRERRRLIISGPLATSDSVCVELHEGVTKPQALRIVRKILEWNENDDWTCWREPWNRPDKVDHVPWRRDPPLALTPERRFRVARQDSTDSLHVTTDCGGIVHSAVEGHEYPFPRRMFITACRPEWASNGWVPTRRTGGLPRLPRG